MPCAPAPPRVKWVGQTRRVKGLETAQRLFYLVCTNPWLACEHGPSSNPCKQVPRCKILSDTCCHSATACNGLRRFTTARHRGTALSPPRLFKERVGHLTGQRPPPHQFIQQLQVSVKVLAQAGRTKRGTGGPDGFVRLLSVLGAALVEPAWSSAGRVAGRQRVAPGPERVLLYSRRFSGTGYPRKWFRAAVAACAKRCPGKTHEAIQVS